MQELIDQAVKAFEQSNFDELKKILSENPKVYLGTDNELLIAAVKTQNFDLILFLLSLGSSPSMNTSQETSPLIEAVKIRNFHMVTLLLKYGADPNELTQVQDSAFTVAKGLKESDEEIQTVAGIFEEDVWQKVSGRFDEDESTQKISGDIQNEIENLLVKGKKENIGKEEWAKISSALMDSNDLVRVLNTSDEVVRKRLEKINTNGLKQDKKPGLNRDELKTRMKQVINPKVNGTQSSIGSDINTPPESPDAPEVPTESKKKKNKKSMSQSADENDNGRTPLLKAVAGGELEVVQDMIEEGANLNTKDFNGMNGLMLAIQYGQVDVFDFLLPKFPKLNEKNKNNANALQVAAMTGQVHFMEKLIDKGANLQSKLKGQNLLMLSSALGHLDVVKFLVEKQGFEPFVERDFKGRTASDYAKAAKKISVLQYYVELGKSKQEAS